MQSLKRSALARLARRVPPGVRRSVNLARGIDTPAVVDRPTGRRIVVIAPHPDDDLLGCGGTLHKHLAAREDVTIVYLTSGERTAVLVGSPLFRRRAVREAEAVAGWDTTGVAPQLRFLHLPEGSVAAGGPALVAAIGDADLIYVPSPIDAHPDHIAAARLIAGCLPHLPLVALVALYEVWSPLYPNVVVDVTDQFESKLSALAKHTSATAGIDYLRVTRGLASYRSVSGLQGRGYAEAFCVLSPPAFTEVVALCQ